MEAKEFGKAFRKKIMTVVLAVTAAASVLVHVASPNGKDLIAAEPPAAVTVVAEPQEEELPQEEEEKKVKKGLFSRLKAWLTSLPAVVRILVVLPLWGIGFVLVSLFHLLEPVLHPALLFLLKWLAFAAVLFGIILLAAKCLFPNKSMKEIFQRLTKKQSLLAIVIVTGAFMFADTVLPFLWDDYGNVRKLILFLVGLAAVTFAGVRILQIRKKKTPKAVPEASGRLA